MKPFTLLQLFPLVSFLLMTYGISAQTIYVKSDATGANDGTSWDNAFTDFSEALDSASEGAMLWVAAGVYHPGGVSPVATSVFTVRQNISIYGGFAGTEVILEERDPSINLTVLSGDINEDDVEGDFSINKTDNTHHVMYVDSMLALVVIDGFTIKGGQTTNAGALPLYLRAGGGLYGLSPVQINNCKFTGNFARNGAGILLTQSASQSSIYTSTFSHNKNTDQGAGVFIWNISDVVIANCSFADNETVRGAVYLNTCRNVLVDNCLFQKNYSPGINGGALFSFQNTDLMIRHCQFTGNLARAGGAIVVSGGQLPTDSITNVRIEHCNFLDNVGEISAGSILCISCPDILISKCEFKNDSAGTGGSIYIDQPQNYSTDTNDIRIDSCLFEGNKAGDKGGGALFMRYTSAKVEHSLFDGNTAYGTDDDGGGHVFQNCPDEYVIFRDVSFNNGHSLDFGGAITAVGKNANYLFENCHFNNNSSEKAGGAVDNGGGVKFIYKKCIFNANMSMSNGGALSFGFDSSEVHIEHSIFTGNEASLNGGAISALFGSQIFEMQNCVLDSNRSLFEFGGAISAGGKDANYLFEFCQFRNNSSEKAGGAVDNGGGAYFIYKQCMFNQNVSKTRGGAMSLSRDSTKVNIEHSAFTGNEAALDGGAISSSFGSQIIEIENCVLDSNRALFGFGGAISMLESGNDNIAALSINNSLFRYNSSKNQGGALNIVDAETRITSCVFAENECDEEGIGAAMSILATDLDTMTAMIMNTTIADNHGYFADGMAQEEETVEASLTTTIQNCIFNSQGGINYNTEAGTPELISHGGNMSDDELMDFILTHDKDLKQTSPLFDVDYSLMSNSPGVDGGVESGAPEFDILGNPRVNAPDMGAYENQMPVSIKENILRKQDALMVYPNPVRDENPTGILKNDWKGEIIVQLSELNGRVVFSERILKTDEMYWLTLPMHYLNTGSYQLLISNGQKSITGNIVKMQ